VRILLFVVYATSALADVSVVPTGGDEEVARRWVTALIADDKATLARLTASPLAVCDSNDNGWETLAGAQPLRHKLDGFLTTIRGATHWQKSLAQRRESALSLAHGETLRLGWEPHPPFAACGSYEMTAALFYDHHMADGEASFELGVIVENGRVARVFWFAAD
jgi:hypothetical protein